MKIAQHLTGQFMWLKVVLFRQGYFKSLAVKTKNLVDRTVVVLDRAERDSHLAALLNHHLGSIGVLIDQVIGIFDLFIVEPTL